VDSVAPRRRRRPARGRAPEATGWRPLPPGAGARRGGPGPGLAALARETGAQARALGPSSPREWQIWEFASETAAREARRQIEKHPGVESVSVPGRRRLAARIPNDPEFAQQWAMLNTGQVMSGRAGAPGADIAAPDYWDANTGSAAVVVAIIDTGADVSHPDLAPNLWVNPGEIAGNGLDDDKQWLRGRHPRLGDLQQHEHPDRTP
jgi:subtilisin family serine protease